MLLVGVELGERPSPFATRDEDRVVAEAVFTSSDRGDLTFEDAFGGDLTPIKESRNRHRPKARGPVGRVL